MTNTESRPAFGQPGFNYHRWPSNEDIDRPPAVDRCLDCRVRRFSSDPDTIELAQGECLGHPPRRAYFVDESMKTPEGYVPSVVTEGVSGYRRMMGNGEHARPWFWGNDLETAQKIAAEANEAMGLSEADVKAIIDSSITKQIRSDASEERANERWEALKKGRTVRQD